jgi:hypothetical protein
MKYFLSFVLCTALSLPVFAQNMDHRHTFTAHAGVNVLNVISAAADDLKPSDIDLEDGATINFTRVDVGSVPTLNLTYDFAINKWFSVGASVGHNRFKMDFTNLDFKNPEGERVTGNGGFSVGRTSINFRPLFHYGNSARLDMYSGFRVGFSIWGARAIGDLQGTDINNQLEDINIGGLRNAAILPQFAITLFGLRGYFTEHFGLGFEINAGSPYFISMGANYRF